MKQILALFLSSILSALAIPPFAVPAGVTGTFRTTNTAVSGGGSPQSFSDDFNRANSSNLGANWTEINGDLEISGNVVFNATASSTHCAAVWNTSCNSVNQYAKMAVTDFNQAFSCYAILRYTDASSPFYLIEVNNLANEITWSRVADATFASITDIQTVSQTIASGDTHAFTIEGTGNSTVLRYWINSTGATPTSSSVWGGSGPTQSLTDDPGSPVNTGTKVGIDMQSTATHAQDLDNWSAGDIP